MGLTRMEERPRYRGTPKGNKANTNPSIADLVSGGGGDLFLAGHQWVLFLPDSDCHYGTSLLVSGQAQPRAGGKELFEKRCGGCHALDLDKEGPRLRGVYGRKADTVGRL